MVQVAFISGGVSLTVTGRATRNAALGEAVVVTEHRSPDAPSTRWRSVPARPSTGPAAQAARANPRNSPPSLEESRHASTLLAAVSALALLGACSTAMEAVRGPELAPIGYPAALVPVNQQILPSPERAPAPPAPTPSGARARAPSSATSAPAASATS